MIERLAAGINGASHRGHRWLSGSGRGACGRFQAAPMISNSRHRDAFAQHIDNFEAILLLDQGLLVSNVRRGLYKYLIESSI